MAVTNTHRESLRCSAHTPSGVLSGVTSMGRSDPHELPIAKVEREVMSEIARDPGKSSRFGRHITHNLNDVIITSRINSSAPPFPSPLSIFGFMLTL